VIVAIPAILFLILAGAALTGKNVKETIKHSREIEVALNTASRFVEEFKQQNNRLPTSAEFTNWTSTFPRRPNTPNGIQILVRPFPSEIEEKYSPAPPRAYVLTYWRGEWDEVYISWTKRSSLVFDESKYYLLGHPLAEGAVMLFMFGVFVIISFKLWPSRRTHT